ncbi:MAG: DUF58 domain-containing protein [Anaerolineales bacterium]|nr:DUF58 domain-containing protein [Anaerolineales bacterium]
MPLFSETTLRKLDRLALAAAQVRAGVLKGERRSTKRGTSVEFADYRDYTRGDDLRRVDWNVYARLERPFIKLLEEEEDLAVHVVVDESRSMDFGADDQHKFTYARRLAAALGYIALAAGDRLSLVTVRGGAPAAQYGPARGRGHALRLINFLEGRQPAGETVLDAALRQYALTARRPGLLLLISDLFSPAGYQAGLAGLQGRGYEVAVLHLLAPEELDPPLAGDLRLVDIETGAAQDVTLDGGLRDLYRRRVQTWRDEIEAHCLKRRITYVPVSTAVPWDELVLYQLRQRGLIR